MSSYLENTLKRYWTTGKTCNFISFNWKTLQKYDFSKKPQAKFTSRSKVMPVSVNHCDVVIFDKLSKLEQSTCVTPYYIEIKDSGGGSRTAATSKMKRFVSPTSTSGLLIFLIFGQVFCQSSWKLVQRLKVLDLELCIFFAMKNLIFFHFSKIWKFGNPQSNWFKKDLNLYIM